MVNTVLNSYASKLEYGESLAWYQKRCSVLAGQTSMMNTALLKPASKLYVDGE